MIRVQIASLPDREVVVAELWVGNVQIAEISNHAGTLQVEFYAPPGSRALRVSLDELEEALRTARRNVLS